MQQRIEQNRYAPSASRSAVKYLLTGKLICGNCGAVYAGESGMGRTGEKYHYYKCVNAKKFKGCDKKAIKKDPVEKAVLDTIIKEIFVDEVISEISERVTAWREKKDTTIPLFQRELSEVEKSLVNIMTAIEQGIITSTTKRRLAELEDMKTDLEVKIACEEIQSQILTREQVEFWLENMQRLNLADTDNRQRIINTFINSIYVHDDKFVVNLNCREESEVIPRNLKGDVSSLTILGEPAI